jgi:hypothetical protein
MLGGGKNARMQVDNMNNRRDESALKGADNAYRWVVVMIKEKKV